MEDAKPGKIDVVQRREEAKTWRKEFRGIIADVTDRKKVSGKADIILNSARGRLQDLLDNMPRDAVELEKWKAERGEEFDELHGILQDWENIGRP